MATKQLIRYECRCEAVTKARGVCNHTWVTRGDGLPANCPNCLARVQVWNKSEHLVGERIDEGEVMEHDLLRRIDNPDTDMFKPNV